MTGILYYNVGPLVGIPCCALETPCHFLLPCSIKTVRALSIQNISQCLPDVSQTLGLEGCSRTWAMVLILRNAHPSGKDRKLAIKKRRFQSEMGEG